MNRLHADSPKDAPTSLKRDAHPSTMDALVLTASRRPGVSANLASKASDYFDPQLHLKRTPTPTLGPAEALVEIWAVSVCGSDYHAVMCGNDGSIQSSVSVAGLESGRILGHEFAGKVVRIGSEVDRLLEGTWVTGDSVWNCRMPDCNECAFGLENHCPNIVLNGFQRNGAFAQYLCAPACSLHAFDVLIPIFGANSPIIATQAEPLGVAAKAIEEATRVVGRRDDRSVLIFGAGPIGYYCAAVARMRGLGPIVIVEPNPNRRRFSTRVCDASVSPDDFRAERHGLEGLHKFAFIFECCGEMPFHAIHAATRPGGVITLLARNDQQLELSIDSMISNGTRVIGTRGHVGYIRSVLDQMGQGLLDPAPFITKRLRGLNQLAEWLKDPGRFFEEGKVVCELARSSFP